MVHGNLRMFLIYEVGVLGGALNFVLSGGGQGALVGCSGGVYTIIGMHWAELLINWGNEHRGFFNHWTRLVFLSAFLALDLCLYVTEHSEVTSYTAHSGGFLTGLVVGVLVLDNLEVTWCEARVLVPGTAVFAAGVLVWSVVNYTLHFPPEGYFWPVEKDSCCVQLVECGGLAEEDYTDFTCFDSVDVYRRNGKQLFDTCAEFVAYRDELNSK